MRRRKNNSVVKECVVVGGVGWAFVRRKETGRGDQERLKSRAGPTSFAIRSGRVEMYISQVLGDGEIREGRRKYRRYYE